MKSVPELLLDVWHRLWWVPLAFGIPKLIAWILHKYAKARKF